MTKRITSVLLRNSEVEAEQGRRGKGAWIEPSWMSLLLLGVIHVLFCVTSLVCSHLKCEEEPHREVVTVF